MKNTIRFEIKQLTEEGTFEGLLSPYGNKDNGDDIVEKGAYTKTLKEQGTSRPLLWQHKADQPIGTIQLEDRADGLWAKGKLLLELTKAKDAYTLIKAGVVKGLSIGFKDMKSDVKDGIRHLKEIALYEGSIVTFPMNEMARVTAVKQRKDDGDDGGPGTPNFNDELAELQLWSMPSQSMSALQNCIYEMFWGQPVAKDQFLSGFKTILSDFGDAFMSFLPDYYDAMTERYGGYEAFSQRIMEIKAAGKTKMVDGEELPASAFLIVGKPDDITTWHLPWKFSTEEKTKSHLRDAMARFNQVMDVSADVKARAKKKLIRLAEEHGITVSDDFKKADAGLEVKAGARFSAETKSSIMAACKGMQGHVNDLMSLVGAEAGEATSDDDSADDSKSEPVNHSAEVKAKITEIMAIL